MMKFGAKSIFWCFAAVAALLGTAGLAWFPRSTSQVERQREHRWQPVPHTVSFEQKVEYPTIKMWKIGIELNDDLYSRDNLERLFRFYSHKYPDKDDQITVDVVTSRNRALNVERVSSGLAVLRADDASFSRSRHRVAKGGEFDEWFYYVVDPNKAADPENVSDVVLRGTHASAMRTVIERSRTSNGSMSIELLVYELPNVEPRGFYYSFEDSDESLIMTVRFDKLIPIPRSQVRFVGRQVVYMFLGWKFAVTTDGGEQWSVWNAEVDLPDWQCCDEALIEHVKIEPSGVGTMSLGSRGGLKQPTVLKTINFGQHWEPSK
jgi:hypothetical protein